LRESPPPFGPGRIVQKTFVARTTSSRRAKSRSARPVISSLAPNEYTLAVSKKLMPSSRARLKKGRASSSLSAHSQRGAPSDKVALGSP
jgi:hypothetical protein